MKEITITKGEYTGITGKVFDTSQSGKYLHVTIDAPNGDGSTSLRNVTLLHSEVLPEAKSPSVVEEFCLEPTVDTKLVRLRLLRPSTGYWEDLGGMPLGAIDLNKIAARINTDLTTLTSLISDEDSR